VSALQRQIAAPNQSAIDEVIQTDAQINQGNSGGPLLNSRGEVIGVNTAIITGSQFESGNVGIGFAVPIDTVKEVAAQLIDEGRVERPYLGIVVQEIDEGLAQVFRLPVDRGLIVQDVRRGTPADRAGLRAGTTQVVVAGESYVLGGDVIVRVAGRTVATASDLRRAINAHRPGDEIELEVFRGSERKTLTAELGQQPSSPG
jgi:S1-C subfamily serine protease